MRRFCSVLLAALLALSSPSLTAQGHLQRPFGITVQGRNFFIADTGTNVVRNAKEIVVGNGRECRPPTGSCGDGGFPRRAELTHPTDVAFDANGNMYIADSGDNRIRMVNANFTLIVTVAGNGVAGFSGDGGPARLAELNHPTSVSVDSDGNLYIADSKNNRIRLVDATTGIILTIAR